MRFARSSRSTSAVFTVLVLFWLIAGWAIVANRQNMIDWWKLRGYSPSSSIAAIANEDTFTDYGRKLFYVNRPSIEPSNTFTVNCPDGEEKTVVLGCYVGGDNGIFLYDVTDARLDGVIEATAAHEMLHAGYERLSTTEKERINALLQSYYDNSLTDTRIKNVIAAYRKSEPTQLLNEMHSVFGTEVAKLPAELEAYYSQYFMNRAVVVSAVAKYEGEFTKRTELIGTYDSRLNSIKEQIDTNTKTLETQQAALSVQSDSLSATRQAGEPSQYNAEVAVYNKAVDSYNALLAQTKALVASYNELVATRNAVAIEQQQLVKALSPQSLPSAE